MRTTSLRPAFRVLLGAALTGTLVTGAAQTASAAAPTQTTATVTTLSTAWTPTPADKRIASMLTSRATTTRFGTAFSGAVLDASSNATVWSRNGTTGRMPASTTKLVTASNALTLFGPDKRFTTRVRAGSGTDQVILQGSGDPSLSSAGLDAMARTTAATLKVKKVAAARVYVDDDVFPTPTLAYGWRSTYVPDSISPIRGVVRDQRDSLDTSAEAARYFAGRLKLYGIPTVGYVGRANAASAAPVLASTTGTSLATMVSQMLLTSDNEIAEALHKLVGIRMGYGATWTGARTAQAKELAAQGLTSGTLYDGSGLSRADRLSAVQLARIVDRGLDSRYRTKLWPLQSAQAIPTAGMTGTLKYRFTTAQSKCAVGRVWAKTGTLTDVVSMAGFTKGTDGRVKVFAFVVNGRTSTTTLKQNVDMLAATVNGCY